MAAGPSAQPAATPNWIADGLRSFFGELAEYARTVADFTTHPSRFAAEWASGERRALNPMGFLATALGILAPALVVLGRMEHESDDSSLLLDALGALVLFVAREGGHFHYGFSLRS
jgi:hypothetical protein